VPPVSLMLVTSSNINIGGKGNLGKSTPASFPFAQSINS